MTQPLSQRAYLAARRMHEQNPQSIPKPLAEDYSYLDITPAPATVSDSALVFPANPAQPGDAANDPAVQRQLAAMQDLMWETNGTRFADIAATGASTSAPAAQPQAGGPAADQRSPQEQAVHEALRRMQYEAHQPPR